MPGTRRPLPHLECPYASPFGSVLAVFTNWHRASGPGSKPIARTALDRIGRRTPSDWRYATTAVESLSSGKSALLRELEQFHGMPICLERPPRTDLFAAGLAPPR